MTGFRRNKGFAFFLGIGILLMAGILPHRISHAATSLEVTLPDETMQFYTVIHLAGQPYITVSDLMVLVQSLDSGASVRWDASTGVFSATLRGQSLSLYRDRDVILVGGAMLDASPLVATRGMVFAPLGSVERILRLTPEIETNIAFWSGAIAVPTPTATVSEPKPTPAPPSPPLWDLPDISRGPTTPAARFDPVGAYLQERRSIVLDPQSPPTGESGADDARRAGADISLRIARRCREILAGHPSLDVLLTRESALAAPSLEERIQVANSAQAKAVISLSMDSSPSPHPEGYTLFIMETEFEGIEGIGPAASLSGSSPGLPRESRYRPYQQWSRRLAETIDEQMIRGGMLSARNEIQPAPFYLLRRVEAPAAHLTLGFWSNDGERGKINDAGFVEASARSLAQAILNFDRQLPPPAPGETR